jgi:hypothetical protein
MHTHINSRSCKGEYLQKYNNNNKAKVAEELNNQMRTVTQQERQMYV